MLVVELTDSERVRYARELYLGVYRDVFVATYLHEVRARASYAEDAPEIREVATSVANDGASTAVRDVFGDDVLQAVLGSSGGSDS